MLVVASSIRATSSRLSTVGNAELTGQVRPVECACVEEAQRRDGRVHRRCALGGLALLDLVVAQILIRGGVRRPAQPACEPRDITQIVALGRPRQAMQVHIFQKALAQRRGRNI
jgi:hypothetical protein